MLGLLAIRRDGGVVVEVASLRAETTRRESPPKHARVGTAEAVEVGLDPSITGGDD